jgi:hypothetical protein
MVERLVFVVTMVTTVFCAAVNAYTLQVGYPLWRVTGPEFAAVHREYLQRLWPVITLPHVVMFLASAAMLWWRPVFVGRWEAVAVFALDAAVVVVSAFVAGPIHGRFERNGVMDAQGYSALIGISALRVVLMVSACGVLCGAMLRGLRAAA